MFACSDRGGNHRRGASYFNLCSTDDEGFGLDGLRGGWIFALANFDRLIAGGNDEPTDALAEDGVAPAARFMASLRGRDPNHDTAGMMFPRDDQPGTAYVGVDRDLFIHDHDWHHVAWQFRYADQTNYFFIDGRLVTRLQLPTRETPGGRSSTTRRAACRSPSADSFTHKTRRTTLDSATSRAKSRTCASPA